MNSVGTGLLSLLFFGAAWYLNSRLEGSKWSPWVVIPTGVIASLMLYASSWSRTVAGWFENILNMFGDSVPTATIMGVLCVLAIVGTFADLIIDSTYNVAAVWALVLAPIMAHGAAGGVGAFVDGAYSGMTLGVLQALGDIFGG